MFIFGLDNPGSAAYDSLLAGYPIACFAFSLLGGGGGRSEDLMLLLGSSL